MINQFCSRLGVRLGTAFAAGNTARSTSSSRAVLTLSEHSSNRLQQYVSTHRISSHSIWVSGGAALPKCSAEHNEEEQQLRLVPQLPALMALGLALVNTTPAPSADAGMSGAKPYLLTLAFVPFG